MRPVRNTLRQNKRHQLGSLEYHPETIGRRRKTRTKKVSTPTATNRKKKKNIETWIFAGKRNCFDFSMLARLSSRVRCFWLPDMNLHDTSRLTSRSETLPVCHVSWGWKKSSQLPRLSDLRNSLWHQLASYQCMKMGVSKNRVPQNGWVYNGKPPLKWKIWGENPPFKETPKSFPILLMVPVFHPISLVQTSETAILNWKSPDFWTINSIRPSSDFQIRHLNKSQMGI